ncbi:Protein Y71H2AM.3 [Aphelenchoides avenae]|nr:Protein Y71H2AM.3 [Aphelenchus avenae]
MTNQEWGMRSFLIEMKPNSEMVSIVVDCPPSATHNEAGEPFDEAVKLGTDRIEVLAGGSSDADENSPCQPKYRADFSGLQLNPKIHCTASWADENRVFMCKVRGEIDGELLEPKSLATLADELLNSKPLEEYVKTLQEEKQSDFHVHCALCGSCLLERDERPTLVALPKDDWLETSQSMDYFCHGTCGHNHGASGTTSEDAEALLGMADNKKAIKQWLPRENKVVLSDSHVMLKENDTLKNRTIREGQLLRCAVCLTEVGNILRSRSARCF